MRYSPISALITFREWGFNLLVTGILGRLAAWAPLPRPGLEAVTSRPRRSITVYPERT
jgi:hypothetical protein